MKPARQDRLSTSDNGLVASRHPSTGSHSPVDPDGQTATSGIFLEHDEAAETSTSTSHQKQGLQDVRRDARQGPASAGHEDSSSQHASDMREDSEALDKLYENAQADMYQDARTASDSYPSFAFDAGPSGQSLSPTSHTSSGSHLQEVISKRTMQNRKAQREFRQRRAHYLKDLEERVRRYESANADGSLAMQRTINQLRSENVHLRTMVTNLQHDLEIYRARERQQAFSQHQPPFRPQDTGFTAQYLQPPYSHVQAYAPEELPQSQTSRPLPVASTSSRIFGPGEDPTRDGGSLTSPFRSSLRLEAVPVTLSGESAMHPVSPRHLTPSGSDIMASHQQAATPSQHSEASSKSQSAPLPASPPSLSPWAEPPSSAPQSSTLLSDSLPSANPSSWMEVNRLPYEALPPAAYPTTGGNNYQFPESPAYSATAHQHVQRTMNARATDSVSHTSTYPQLSQVYHESGTAASQVQQRSHQPREVSTATPTAPTTVQSDPRISSAHPYTVFRGPPFPGNQVGQDYHPAQH